ncbi:hypothetical protein BJX64DRAFT_246845 [Aspergillus heterothallicus]
MCDMVYPLITVDNVRHGEHTTTVRTKYFILFFMKQLAVVLIIVKRFTFSMLAQCPWLLAVTLHIHVTTVK